MLINHPPDGATCVFVCCLTLNHQVALRVNALFVMAGGHIYFHRTVRDRTALLAKPLRILKCNVHVFALTVD